MKNYVKILALALAVIMVLALAACSNGVDDTTATTTSADDTTAPEETKDLAGEEGDTYAEMDYMAEDLSKYVTLGQYKGLSVEAANLTREYVKEHNPLDAVNDEIIPALNIVGEGFEKKTVYLPELLMSAEAAKSAFEVIKESATDSAESAKCRVVIATVKGDIHDIGKNIVKLILENYGFMITDLGKDVAPEVIVDKVVELKAPIVGLSALMTTTIPAMEETVKLLRLRAPWCKIMVGGAVLTKEYAEQIGADAYASDAMEGVRYCESVNDTFVK